MTQQVQDRITFDDFKISNPLRNAIKDLNFYYPTPIQKETFPIIMSGKNVVGIAQTGTGKTLAYLLPLLQQLRYSEQIQPRILVIVPTRELVLQVVEELNALTVYMNVRVLGIYGGANINTQKVAVYQGSDVLVATPGRLLDINLTGVLKLKTVKKVVIDEVDEMLNLGFRPQLISILERLPERRQNLMFSATMLPGIETIIKDFFPRYEKIEIVPHGTPLDLIVQQAYHVPNFYTKANLLSYLIQESQDFSKVLVFVDNKRIADRLYEELKDEVREKVGVIHSNKSQNYRFRMIEEFESGQISFLIATDLLARGLDIRDISHVVNFDMPETPEHYIHRIGRTGRQEKDGVAISFINEVEQESQMFVEQLMKKRIEVLEFPETVVVSSKFTDEEIVKPKQVSKAKIVKITNSGGAYHEKSEKNQQENSGSPALKRKKFKKPIRRSGRH